MASVVPASALLGVAICACLLACAGGSAATLPAVQSRASGRVLPSPTGDGSVSFDWPQVSLSVCVTGASSVAALVGDSTGSSELTVIVNGVPTGIVTPPGSGLASVTLASGLSPDRTNEITIVKRTEAVVGVSTVVSFTAEGGDDPQFVACGRLASRRIEVIGDSISCGYGDLGTAPCHFSPQTEDAGESYTALVASLFEAQLHLQCWSGKGVVRNFGQNSTTSPDPFPVYYPRVLATAPSPVWEPAGWEPDVVIINLGTNDFSTEPVPPAGVFSKGYMHLLDTVRTMYGKDPYIVMLCGPMIEGECCSEVEQIAVTRSRQDSRVEYVDLHVLSQPTDYGCDGHPSAQGHAKMASSLEQTLRKILGW